MKVRNTALATGSAVAITLLMSGVAFADTTQATQGAGWGMGRGHGTGMMHRAPGVFGTVTAVSGNTITLTSAMPPLPDQQGQSSQTTTTPTTYTVDASGATVTKGGAASSVAKIAVGDPIMVEGTVTGTDVVATEVHDGPPLRGGMMGEKRAWDGASTTPRGMGAAISALHGNGQPVIGGTVSAVSGNTVTITNRGAATYAIDVSDATVMKSGATSTIASVQIGDAVLAQGTINGTNVTATSLIDHGAAPTQNSGSGTDTQTQLPMGGFFGRIGGFFKSLFGFF